ncbi:MAG: hypothetical protein CMJ76_12815 [Planctomycetaceae bacterium]|nr:hypothetical protein [Planctomycetaceae bacterium]
MPDLHDVYEKLKAEGEVLAGNLMDIRHRVAILTHIYIDSGRNHAFSQIAAHGALWGLSYFEAGGSLGRLVACRYCYSAREKAFRLGILREFSEAFRRVNRAVCIDTYANYEFTKIHGETPGCEDIVPPNLLDALNRVHHASRNNVALTAKEKKDVFEQSFRCEQELTVAPGVKKAVSEFECKIMRWLCLHPFVRFTYFPNFRYFVFRDFSNTDERIKKGLRAYDLAERVGWDRVYGAMEYYGQMPREFFSDPAGHFAGLREEVIRKGQIASRLES